MVAAIPHQAVCVPWSHRQTVMVATNNGTMAEGRRCAESPDLWVHSTDEMQGSVAYP